MKNKKFYKKAKFYLNTLCSVKPNRRVGSLGNQAATDFFVNIVSPWNYSIDTTSFNSLDYESKQPKLFCKNNFFEVFVSPYSLSCDIHAKLVVVSTIEELENCDCYDKILLLKDKITSEQLMPKNFVFYNPNHHKKIYKLLEEKQPLAIITATRKNPQLVGSKYPFPLINDGDFNIPSVYCTDLIGEEIANKTKHAFKLIIKAKRIPTKANNVIISKNPKAEKKIVICAHIDAVENTPGASDNASGIVVELLLAEMLKNYKGKLGIEIITFNGEDHYSAGGQMDYLKRYKEQFKKIRVVINIDDVGYIKGKNAYSLYECPKQIQLKIAQVFDNYSNLLKGEKWFQGDHMIFVQKSIPAVAITSDKVAELMSNITHSPKDTPEIIDCYKLVKLAFALKKLIIEINQDLDD